MASTNKTTHYELSQYVGSDKPTYLTDYNNDMSAIDTGIYNAQTKADSAYTLAGTADGKADNAQTTANTAVTNAGTANTNIGTMTNLETTEKTTLVKAINEVKEQVNDLEPVVLYEDPLGTGTNSTVSLTDSAANYTKLEIIYNENGYYSDTTIFEPNGKDVELLVGHCSFTSIILCAKVMTISGTSMTIKDGNRTVKIILTADGNNVTAGDNNIYITKVVGYKD